VGGVALRATIAIGLIGLTMSLVRGDAVQLVNGDVVNGEITSLDQKQLVLESDNFGEMKIPRDKVALIALGDRPLPTARPAAGQPAGPGTAPLQNPQVQSQLNRLMQQAFGGGQLGDVRQNVEETRRGLEDLQKDLGNESASRALENYIKMFEVFGNIVPPGQSGAATHQSPPAGSANTPRDTPQ
jgi:hypothetical protein